MSDVLENSDTPDVVLSGGNGDGGGEPRRPGLWESVVAYLRSIKHSPRIESY